MGAADAEQRRGSGDHGTWLRRGVIEPNRCEYGRCDHDRRNPALSGETLTLLRQGHAGQAAQSEWARCRHWIVAALAHSPGLETIEDVERLVGERVYQFWAGKRSAVITEIVEFQRTRGLMVRHAGGNMDELVSMCPSIEEFARALA